jgi:hypothetical protein
MAQQFCQGCGASLMSTLRMCPTCGSKNLEANPPHPAPPSSTTANQTANNSSAIVVTSNHPKGLGGWLILVGMGLIIGSIKLIVSCISLYKPIIELDLLKDVADINSELYNPNLELLIYAETIVNTFLISLQFYLIYLFLRKKNIFPKYFIFITLFTILMIPIDAYLASIVLSNEKIFDEDTIKSFFQSLFAGAIWIPYMIKSKRVRNTFIED